jgi:hypothetical protein
MPKYAYVQIHGIEKPAKVKADAVVEQGSIGMSDYKLVLKLGDKEVGRFSSSVEGWWIQDEPN